MHHNKLLHRIKDSASMKLNDTVKIFEKNGKNIINLTIGQPDLDLELEIKEKLIQAVKMSYSHYTNKQGVVKLREKILEWNEIDNKYDISNVIVTPGAKYAIYTLLKSILNHGDEVIIFKPYWVSYIDMVNLCGGKPIIVECNDDFTINFDDLKKKINSRTKAMIINNPNNPSGNILSIEDMVKLNKICIDSNLYLISDEIYSTIVFSKFKSFLQLEGKRSSHIIAINGVSKSIACTGLRIGYIIADKDVVSNFLKVHQHIATCAGSLEQKALSLISKEQYAIIHNKHKQIYKKRRNLIVNRINGKSKIHIPEGTFYMLLNIGDEFNSSLEFSNYLINNYGIALVPGEAYGIDNWVRISFATSEEKLRNFIEIINGENLLCVK
ncbi:pyridoxal phosphate-dependent aminotransferase [Wukongibacter sp. M2B1]|uniref:pyridoxal phosphate-dependent aminotransferase n=1 Tax=Wukongibacter sp. M2B1 TaxID=3088895 RepID=UPI003D7900F3